MSVDELVLIAHVHGQDGKQTLPEVHIARLDRDDRVLHLREAGVRDDGSVSVGVEHKVNLDRVSAVEELEAEDAEGVALALCGPGGDRLVELRFSSEEEAGSWIGALRELIGGRRKENGGRPEDGAALNIRSKELQEQIESLDKIGARRDKQLEKMVKRIEGATEMLVAVQEMCDQQKRVLIAQEAALGELEKECAGAPPPPPVPSPSSPCSPQRMNVPRSPQAPGQSPVPPLPPAPSPASPTPRRLRSRERPGSEAENDEQKAREEMIALLRQADEMQQVIKGLEASAAQQAEEGLSSSGASSPKQDADEEEDTEDVAAAARELEEKIKNLQAEKAVYERQLQTSLSEQNELQERLGDMRALMERFQAVAQMAEAAENGSG
eukprot:TRINITY_DN47081_c0_g1_i1.p1 TRINITY_DN47081_c0_g1~~TRINITY_DN47081_c0_g1_i1.p1  ORF type:complete len:382 (-),score=145.84 TRINITY_DN47081_c0_g1_i1:137-1282(-)